MAVAGLCRIAAMSHLLRVPATSTLTLFLKSRSTLSCLSTLQKNVLISGQPSQTRSFSSRQSSTKATENTEGFEDLDKPVKFSTSKASSWTAEQTFTGTTSPDVPWMQPYIVIFSTAMFLLYFCVLREENDLDEEIGKPLWERIPGLEKKQLKVVYDYNLEHNIDNTAIEARMRELELKEEQELLAAKAKLLDAVSKAQKKQ